MHSSVGRPLYTSYIKWQINTISLLENAGKMAQGRWNILQKQVMSTPSQRKARQEAVMALGSQVSMGKKKDTHLNTKESKNQATGIVENYITQQVDAFEQSKRE